MAKNTISNGVVHNVPKDLKKILTSKKAVSISWENITPLARNEWICWIEDAKKIETRHHRIQRTEEELLKGKRRPCCWAGCIHRGNKIH